MRTRPVLGLVVALACGLVAIAQPPLFTDAFTKEEFAARRSRVLDRVGDAVVLMAGTVESGYLKFRQNNQFFYLTGVEVPRALLYMDGRSREVVLFLPPRNERMERVEGPILVPGAEAAALTGIPRVLPRDDFGGFVDRLAAGGRTIYMPHRMEALGAGAPESSLGIAKANLEDPWDGRPSREAAFIERIRQRAPGSDVRDLDPILDAMRVVKSPRELALIRQATRLSGLGLMEAMRSAQPDQFEYELEAAADFVFKKHNAQGIAYFALVAAGQNAYYPHYHAAQGQLKATDLVLMDYAPDYKYYASDVTRMFPASGTFSPWQREVYTIYLRLYRALLTSIRPGPVGVVLRDAVRRMDDVMAGYTFTDRAIEAAARRLVDGFRAQSRTPGTRGLGHMVGMEVHDVALPYEVLEPGMVFTIEPALTIPEQRVYVRLEDVVLVTEEGYENLSDFVPMEPEAIEKLMAEPGILEAGAR